MKTDRHLNRMIQSETRADGSEVMCCRHRAAETELQTADGFQIRFDCYDRSRPGDDPTASRRGEVLEAGRATVECLGQFAQSTGTSPVKEDCPSKVLVGHRVVELRRQWGADGPEHEPSGLDPAATPGKPFAIPFPPGDDT